ncbi:MAG: DUF1820 domain-containing protein [Pseudoxanthomonas suwonensis]|nr:MAG: DUF1820 domain-containing protein [Pseudoxanthomonas suwonensis]
MPAAPPLYKVTFLQLGQVYTLYAGQVGASDLWGFVRIAELVFDVRDGLVVDPTEERLRDEFADTGVLHVPMQHISSVQEVQRKGKSAIRDAADGSTVVTPFPLPGKPRGS